MGYGLYGLGHDPKDVPPPKFGKAPMELLTDKTVDPPSLGSTYGFQTAMGMLGAGAHGTTNWVYKRPAIAGNSTKFQLFNYFAVQTISDFQ